MSTPPWYRMRRTSLAALASTLLFLIAPPNAAFADESAPPAFVRLSAAPRGDRAAVIDLTHVRTPAVPVAFEVPFTQELHIQVMDLEGNLVATLAEGLWAAGKHVLAWQQAGETEGARPSGVFVIRLEHREPADTEALAMGPQPEKN